MAATAWFASSSTLRGIELRSVVPMARSFKYFRYIADKSGSYIVLEESGANFVRNARRTADRLVVVFPFGRPAD
ncbi:MAG: hypothetical protein K0R28_3929 [Paenibacillus sp.]|nr:hypothetical protein [Paenibacillus sp.]